MNFSKKLVIKKRTFQHYPTLLAIYISCSQKKTNLLMSHTLLVSEELPVPCNRECLWNRNILFQKDRNQGKNKADLLTWQNLFFLNHHTQVSNRTLFKVKPVITLMTHLVVFYVCQQTIRLSQTSWYVS